MRFPIGPDDVKLIQGHSGKGVQFLCPCGCMNMLYLEVQEPTWKCRNCGQVFTYDFRGLVEQVRAREPQATAAAAPADQAASG